MCSRNLRCRVTRAGVDDDDLIWLARLLMQKLHDPANSGRLVLGANDDADTFGPQDAGVLAAGARLLNNLPSS